MPKRQQSDVIAHIEYDETGVYLSEALATELKNCKPVTIMHRKLII